MVITVSRQAESGDEEIIRLVAERTGVQVADRAILEHMAQHEGLPVSHLARFDEVVPGMLESLIAEWQTSVSQTIYLRRLIATLLLLEHEDDIIIVGRGAAFVLTDPGTLHVRIVAPMPCRVATLSAAQRIPTLVAERMLKRSDEARARFIRQAFDADVESPYHYDLTINTAELAAAMAAGVIVLAAQQKATRRGRHAEVAEDFVARVDRLRRSLRHPRIG